MWHYRITQSKIIVSPDVTSWFFSGENKGGRGLNLFRRHSQPLKQ